MAIGDDFTIDYVNRRIYYSGSWTGTIADNRYTVNELYSYLQDTFDEPAQMDDPVPMSAQTPTQYTLINRWFIDDESVKALYSGSIQSSNWTYSAGSSAGITQVRYTAASADPPVAGDIGVTLTDGTSGATGLLLAVDTTRKVAWIRNTNANQFAAARSQCGHINLYDPDRLVSTLSEYFPNVFLFRSLQSSCISITNRLKDQTITQCRIFKLYAPDVYNFVF